jgi:hypothetical protein
VPNVVALASPSDPAAFEIVATPVFDDAQVTVAVMSLVVLSVYVPVAVNFWVAPGAIDGLAGVTLMDTTAARTTVRVVDPESVFGEGAAAEIVVVPWANDCAKPFEPAAFEIVATRPSDDAQVTVVVTSWVVKSE